MISVDKHTELTTTEARQGETTGSVRYVLGISPALAVAVGIILYFVYA